ncbi:MAG: DUF1571 domain-containing protein, partial [Isosphaeraceae bacterium]
SAGLSSRSAAKPPATSRVSGPPVDPSIADPIAAALDAIARCLERFAEVRDYRCKFVKRERIDGTLNPPHVMRMKARTSPRSVYFKFEWPNKGREAIFVEGRHKGKVVAHDVGLFKVLAGTMLLDPKGATAMEDCRHPITEAGLGALVETVAKHWAVELKPGDSIINIRPDMTFADRKVTLIESIHPTRKPEFLHHKVRLYIDHEHGLPVRLEAYDWPKAPSAAPELLEEYSYLELELNVGLSDADFDPANRAYSFGRF